jgi:hypothetical protein
MRFLLLLVLCCGTASAQVPSERDEWEWYRSLQAVASKCDDPVLDLPIPHVIRPHDRALELASALMRVDQARCPGVTSDAVSRLLLRIGEPERAEVDVDLVRLGWKAAEKGVGMAPDPALADRLGRILWLFHDQPPSLARTSESELRLWLAEAGPIALLQARNRDPRLRTQRSLELHSGIALQRGHSAYDPALAASLLEDGQMLGRRGVRERLAALLTDGTHLPPDYARAARIYLGSASWEANGGEAQGALLQIGRAAAEAAKAPEEIATALRILSASAIDGRFDSRKERDSLLRKAGRIHSARLTGEQEEVIFRALDFRIGFDLPDAREDDPPAMKPILLRALIGPDGRAISTEVVQSSGSPMRDRIVQGAWIDEGYKVDLGEVARDRFVRVDLPPVDPLMTTMKALESENKRQEDRLLARLAEARRASAAGGAGPGVTLIEALDKLAAWYEGKSRSRESEPVIRELIGLHSDAPPGSDATARRGYEARLAKALRQQGRFDEAATIERDRLERERALSAPALVPR